MRYLWAFLIYCPPASPQQITFFLVLFSFFFSVFFPPLFWCLHYRLPHPRSLILPHHLQTWPLPSNFNYLTPLIIDVQAALACNRKFYPAFDLLTLMLYCCRLSLFMIYTWGYKLKRNGVHSLYLFQNLVTFIKFPGLHWYLFKAIDLIF